jgi:Flp pilus assembly protein TadG
MKNNKGSISVIFVIVLSLIIGSVGLAVDYGYAVVKDFELTNAIDAATLAAAQDLDDVDKATATANEYLIKNDVDPSEVTITFSDDNTSIKIESTKIVQNRFMRIFNINTSQISASSKVSINPVVKVTGGIKPFGVEDRELIYGEEVELKSGATGNHHTGNFGGLALGY